MYTITIGLVRLANGPTKYEGRVEVFYNGEWGTVCDDGWDLNNAVVVCRQLGFDLAITVRDDAYYGQGSGQIWLDDVNCTGTELEIGDCSHDGWGNHNCYNFEDVGVQCSTHGNIVLYSVPYKFIILNQVCVWHAFGFLELLLSVNVCMRVCVWVCLPQRLRITSGMMWCDIVHILYDWSNKFYGFYMAAVVDIVSGHDVSIHTCCRN